MKKLTILIVLVLILLQVKGCNLFTSYESYGFEEDYPSCKDDQVGFYFHPKITSEVVNKIVFPGVYDRDIYKGPYKYYFSIGGDFEKITSVKSKFIINGKSEITVPVSLERLNANRTVNWTGNISFPDGYHNFPVEWDKVESLAMETEFEGEKNGNKIHHYVKTVYEKKYEKEVGNRFLWYIVSF